MNASSPKSLVAFSMSPPGCPRLASRSPMSRCISRLLCSATRCPASIPVNTADTASPSLSSLTSSAPHRAALFLLFPIPEMIIITIITIMMMLSLTVHHEVGDGEGEGEEGGE